MTNENLAGALADLQKKLPKIAKSETANAGSYTYAYADLADITDHLMPLLGELGLSFIATPTYSDGRFVLAYSLLHVSGEERGGEWPLPATGTPQQIGGAITYGRRYCLCAVTGVAPGGDDNDAANVPAMDVYQRAESRSRDWRAEADRVRTLDEARELWMVAKADGASNADLNHITARGNQFAEPDDQEPPRRSTPHGSATQKQVGAINGLLKKAGYGDDLARYARLSALTGREITSSKELSKTEASDTFKALEAEIQKAGDES